MSIYNVKSGDTLVKIAQQNNVSVDELAKLNPEIQDINKISIGQTIKLPTKKEETPTTKSIESEKALLTSIQEEKKVTTELEAKEQVSKEVSKRLQSLESWTDEDWKDKDKITSLSSVLGQLGGAESTREEQIKNLYEKVQTRKKIKKELGRYADVSEIPENIIKQANAAGLKPEEHTNFWLGALKGFGQTVNSFASKAGTAMENVGMANPQGIYGGAGMAAQRRMQEEALAKEEARYREGIEFRDKEFDEMIRQYNQQYGLAFGAQELQKDIFDYGKLKDKDDKEQFIKTKRADILAKLYTSPEFNMLPPVERSDVLNDILSSFDKNHEEIAKTFDVPEDIKGFLSQQGISNSKELSEWLKTNGGLLSPESLSKINAYIFEEENKDNKGFQKIKEAITKVSTAQRKILPKALQPIHKAIEDYHIQRIKRNVESVGGIFDFLWNSELPVENVKEIINKLSKVILPGQRAGIAYSASKAR